MRPTDELPSGGPAPSNGVPEARPGSTKPDPVLRAERLSRSFGGLLAVDVDRLEVQRGTITALIGPNGAGKTTLFNLLTGFDGADRGRVEFDNRDVTGVPAHRLSRRGLVRTFQLTKALSRMSVLDNVKLGAPQQRGERLLASVLPPLWSPQERAVHAKAVQWLQHFDLGHMAAEYAGTLSGGQRKLLEMARAMMVEPTLLLLDEPMAGVNPALTQSLLGHIAQLRDQGVTIFFIEHNMDVVMGISDWVVCMAEGSVIAEGPPASVASDPAVIDAYLGIRAGEASA